MHIIRTRGVIATLTSAIALALAGPACAGQAAAAHDAMPAAAQPQAAPQDQIAAPERAGDQDDDVTEMATVIVTGTRANNRTASASLAPIDVVPDTVLTQTGSFDTRAALARAIPSLDFPSPTETDQSVFQQPVSLRGLSPDQALVLVNGKRWHPGAVFLVASEVGQGSQSPDISQIPLAAIDHIEVLRDGASAQYGSDAIAGVVNLILKRGPEGGKLEVTGGEYSAGDGLKWQTSTSFGLNLGADGWLRVAAQVNKQMGASRSKPDRRYAFLGPKFKLGQTPFQNKNIFLNMAYDLTPGMQFYSFGHYAQRTGKPRGYYRYGTDSGAPANSLMAELFPDGNGFLPLERGHSIDESLVLGLRGSADGGWRWDVSANYGSNRVSYYNENTVNFAFYDDFGYSPSTMKAGLMRASLSTINLDISKVLGENWTLSFGAEYLHQKNQLESGAKASWYVSKTSPFGGGAQGFSGWSPADAYKATRSDLAEYVQLEGNLTDRLGVSVAARHEKYSDFKATTSGALSARFDFTPSFALRGTLSTGFRAPGLAQEHYSDTASSFIEPGNQYGLPQGLYLTGTVGVNNPLARLLGSESLEPEKSTNLSFGMVWSPTRALTTTLDVFQIDIRNIIAQSSGISLLTPEVQQYLAENGVSQPEYIGLDYYTNAGKLRDRGLAWVSTFNKPFDNGVSWLSTLSFSWHQNKVVDIRANPPELEALGDTGFQRLTRSQIKGVLANLKPSLKGIWTNNVAFGAWEFTGTATTYGRYTKYSSTSSANDIVNPSRTLVDVAATYAPHNWRFTLGVDNLFNTYPKRLPHGFDVHGSKPYPPNSPFSALGAFVYGKVGYHW